MMIMLRLWLILSLSVAAPLDPKVDKEDLVTDDIPSVDIVNGDGSDSDGLHNQTLENTNRDSKHAFHGGDIDFSGTIDSSGNHARINIGSISINAESQEYQPEVQAVDGGWSNWGNYGQCSKECEGGIQTRTRTCTNPVPKNNGLTCEQQNIGNEIETTDCNLQACAIDGGWTSYGSCTKTCKGGVKTRTCTNPAPQHGGKPCVGDASVPCNQNIDCGKLWRDDRRCGTWYLLPNLEPAQCDPTSDNPCCSSHGFCGSGADHCNCETCVNHAASCMVHVGTSNSNTISATVWEGCICPTVVKTGNWLGGGTYPDEFKVTQDGSSLQVQRTDSNTGWGMDLAFKCFKGSCKVHVGKSDLNTISATVSEGCICPPVVKKGNWLGHGTHTEEFKVTQDGSSLQVQRTDSNTGWEMDLAFMCIRDGGWTNFGECSKTCKGGVQTRTCMNPPPHGGGKPCSGDDSQPCNEDVACENWISSGENQGRCGEGYWAPSGVVAECDPNSKDKCCSKGGWCGHYKAHCNCVGCKIFN